MTRIYTSKQQMTTERTSEEKHHRAIVFSLHIRTYYVQETASNQPANRLRNSLSPPLLMIAGPNLTEHPFSPSPCFRGVFCIPVWFVEVSTQFSASRMSYSSSVMKPSSVSSSSRAMLSMSSSKSCSSDAATDGSTSISRLAA